MTLDHAKSASCAKDRDRDVIRVDFASDKLGIAAALRQAFAAAAHEQSAYDFDRLLNELQ